MMITQFALAAQGGFFSAERASTAGIVTLQGMLTIFAVLAILWGATEVMHGIFSKDSKKPSVPKKVEPQVSAEQKENSLPAVPNEQDAAIAAAIGATLAAYEDNGATIAAITAAIMAVRAENGESGSFRVVSFKRTGRRNRL